MRKLKAIVLGVFLVAALAVATPVLAGPQNGEVNHATGSTGDCVGPLPDGWVEQVTTYLFTYVLEWVPVDFTSWFGDGGE